MTLRRQHLLQSQWYFSCECRRCQDPTECGTMGNAITCSLDHGDDEVQHNEHDGYFMLPENPRELDSDWICRSKSSHVVKASYAKGLITEVEGRVTLAEKVIIY